MLMGNELLALFCKEIGREKNTIHKPFASVSLRKDRFANCTLLISRPLPECIRCPGTGDVSQAMTLAISGKPDKKVG